MTTKPWLASYPPGVPHSVDYHQYRSINQMMDESFKKFADRQAFECMGKYLTYAQLDTYSNQLAAHFQSLGLKPGARIALMMPNVLQYPIAIAAVLRAGYVVVNVNPLYTPRELEHQLNDSGAQALVILENFAHVYEQVRHKVGVEHVIVTSMGELMGLKGHIVNFVVRKVKKLVPQWQVDGHMSFKAALANGQKHTLIPPHVTHDDVAFLQYTGGTTGVSKGATLLHRNILANLLQTEAWLEPGLRGKDVDQLVFICALPLYHIFALTACCMFGIRAGGLNILVTNPKDIPGFIKLLAKLPKFHIFPAVNTLFNALMNHPQFGTINFSSILVTIGGGMAVQKAVADRWQSLTGCPVAEGYGLSETSPVACCNTPWIKAYTGHIGLPVPGTDVVIRDEEGRDQPFGQPGEICIRGPQVMAGYWNRTEETAKVMTADGYFKSGDIGYMDESGYVKIIDRKKDMILVSGFNVYPNEVEDVIAMLPGVLECAAVGVPDAHSGEVVKVFIVKKDPALTEEQVIEHCKEQLTNYKRPKFIEFRTELPKTNVGKILRRELRT
ncbi:long-chain-fatty-acid--CoA ligase [Polynucleobacter sp. MWH-Loch1C5]|jgi:long-chain acyl-CoA synthetase|uniref:long-chain-fatty-acid--CoA ligase n=1 Tax=Polynucleobacter sp. MWH-Loch1C5 TaxID=2689108 RepID=UPI001C0B7217|nr:long-chain-fatty-acid--CoA ligase [Polynucleobacter sp. MWH-Loch1C5]MBU3542312.1 long-chain-fatty-acid--CoA ligase [Polynucleobacter sp. MWH-Loch1C5]